MYNIAKLSEASKNVLQTPVGNPELTAMALARAISAWLPLPPEEQKVASEYYAAQVLTRVRESVSMFSDVAIIDASRTLELVRTFWLVRYNAAYPATAIFAVEGFSSEAQFLGFAQVISAAEIQFIRDNGDKLANLFNSYSTIIQEIGGYTEAAAKANEAEVLGGSAT